MALNEPQGNKELLRNHLTTLTELIDRDKNRPSVLMWSLANEPRSAQPGAGEYFKVVAAHAKYLDSTRPVTIVVNEDASRDQVFIIKACLKKKKKFHFICLSFL